MTTAGRTDLPLSALLNGHIASQEVPNTGSVEFWKGHDRLTSEVAGRTLSKQRQWQEQRDAAWGGGGLSFALLFFSFVNGLVENPHQIEQRTTWVPLTVCLSVALIFFFASGGLLLFGQKKRPPEENVLPEAGAGSYRQEEAAPLVASESSSSIVASGRGGFLDTGVSFRSYFLAVGTLGAQGASFGVAINNAIDAKGGKELATIVSAVTIGVALITTLVHFLFAIRTGNLEEEVVEHSASVKLLKGGKELHVAAKMPELTDIEEFAAEVKRLLDALKRHRWKPLPTPEHWVGFYHALLPEGHPWKDPKATPSAVDRRVIREDNRFLMIEEGEVYRSVLEEKLGYNRFVPE